MPFNRRLIVVLLALVAAPALAAPLAAPATPPTPTPAENEGEPLVVPSAMDLPAARVPGTNRTIDLLLEMQSKDPGAPASAGTNRSARSAALARSNSANAAAASRMLDDEPTALGVQPNKAASAPAPALFGSETTAAPITATAPSNAEWHATQRSGAGPSRGSGEVRRWALISPELVAWLRANRDWVIGGAVLSLALMWGVTAVFGRRRA